MSSTADAPAATFSDPVEAFENGDDDVRTRLLLAAERCFYRVGITASGVDALAAEAGVSKRTLYNQFGSKEGLVAAYLEVREGRWQHRLEQLLEEAGDDPVEQVLAYVHGYAICPVDDVFRGCALINAAAELADPGDPSLELVVASIDKVGEGVADILAGAGVPRERARELGNHVLIALEGAVAVAGIRRDGDEVLRALDLVRALVEPAVTAARG